MTVQITSPAKINLYLKVTGRRPDGYHELDSLMCPVSLADTLTVGFDRPGIHVACGHPGVPEDETNLAFQAARLFFRETGQPPAVEIHIKKRIPVAGGMGGGSSNAAAVLKALNRHFRSPFSDSELEALGSGLGADVPFFIKGRPARAEGIGTLLTPVSGLPSCHLILISFPFSVSTAGVYKNLNLGLTTSVSIPYNRFFHKQAEQGDASLRFRDGISFSRLLFNDLETVTVPEHPDIAEAKAQLIRLGADGVLMSGSGPTVFGLFSEKKQAEEALSSLRLLSKGGSLQKGEPEKRQFLPAVLIV